MSISFGEVSIVIPAKNEAKGLGGVLPDLMERYPDAEIIVVNDGSEDATSDVILSCGAIEINHPYSKGNGAALKSGARAATRKWIVFMDGDGQHGAELVGRIVGRLDDGYDMVVGARSKEGQAGFGRWFANTLYNKLASWMVGHEVKDLTSGLRGVRRSYFLRFMHMYPNGFSCPTTSTMAFFRAGFSISYVPVSVAKRIGESHISPLKDGIRFLLIIFKIGTLYSPLKVFSPIALVQMFLGLSYYGYTLTMYGRLTNMSVILFVSALTIFLIGLVSEQITVLMYKRDDG